MTDIKLDPSKWQDTKTSFIDDLKAGLKMFRDKGTCPVEPVFFVDKKSYEYFKNKGYDMSQFKIYHHVDSE